MKRILVFCFILLANLFGQTYIIPDLQRDDFASKKTWWKWQNHGNQSAPQVYSGYFLAQLIDPLNGQTGGSLTDINDGMENVGIMTAEQRPIYGKDDIMDVTLRIKMLDELRPGSRGAGFWKSESPPVTINQASWFMEQVADSAASYSAAWASEETWWRSRVHKGLGNENEVHTNLDTLSPPIDNMEWHTYRVHRHARSYYEFYVDGELVQHTDASELDNGFLNEDYSFNCWNDNLVYHFTTNSFSGNDTIEVYKNGWLGQIEFLVDFVEITSDGYDPSYSRNPIGSILLREVPTEIDDGIDNGLWKSYSFDSDGGPAVILATAKAEEYDSYDDDDDLKMELNGIDFGYDTDRSWDGDADQGMPKTIMIDTSLSAGTHQLSFYSEVTPILYDATVLGSSEGSVVLNETVNETAPSGSSGDLWKTYNFSCDAGEVTIYISGSADEEPGWNHQNAEIDSTDDDELKVVLDEIDYGWGSDSSMVGNALYGDTKTILIRETVAGGSHSLKLYVRETPTVYKVVVFAEAGDYSLPVQLSSFEANRTAEGVLLSWITQSEIENRGFHILKAQTADSIKPDVSQYKKINDSVISGHGNTSVQHTYTFMDTLAGRVHYLWYRLQQFDINGAHTEYGPVVVAPLTENKHAVNPPEKMRLLANYPNPFNPSTTIRIAVNQRRRVRLSIYDINGRQVRNLLNEVLPQGFHEFKWDGNNDSSEPLPSGVYFYRMLSGGEQQTRKMMLIR